MELLGNFTDERMNVSELESWEHQQMVMMRSVYDVIISIVCAFGFVGNVLNVFVFSWKRHQRIMDEIERCTTTCLVALAMSDMMFCFCAFPGSIFPWKDCLSHGEFGKYYNAFSIATIDFFILTSTMLTVITAIMRYLAICHPFQSRRFVSMKTTISSLIVVCILALAISLPKLWRYKFIQDNCPEGYIHLYHQVNLFNSEMFEHTYRLIWAIIGNFVPLVILLYCNVRLIVALHQSKQLRFIHSREHDTYSAAHRRITITLITIIILFLILVAPSEISKFVMNMHDGPHKKFTFFTVSLVTNMLQTINFSVNFILYYVIIAPFRRALHEFVCLNRTSSNSSKTSKNYCSTKTSKQQTVLLLSVRENGKHGTEAT